MVILKYAGETISEVSRVYELSWKKAYRGILPDDYLDALSETKWSSHLLRDADRLLLAKEGETIIGVSTYSPARDPSKTGWGEIISIYLLPSHYRRGIGTELLKAAVKELTTMGYKRIYLWVLEENIPARKFYEFNGFSDSGGFRTDTIGGRTVRELRYVYTIK